MLDVMVTISEISISHLFSFQIQHYDKLFEKECLYGKAIQLTIFGGITMRHYEKKEKIVFTFFI